MFLDYGVDVKVVEACLLREFLSVGCFADLDMIISVLVSRIE